MDKIIYSKEVLEFTAVANEYCNLLEKLADSDGRKLLLIMQRLLPLLYIKTVMLPGTQPVEEDELEKFVDQGDWDRLRNGLKIKIGAADDYRDIFPESPGQQEDEFISSISENLTDIYQDLKDFLMRYRIGTESIMNDAVWDLQESYRLYWGQKLVNSLRAIHFALLDPESIGSAGPDDGKDLDSIDTSDWIMTKRQKETENENDELQG